MDKKQTMVAALLMLGLLMAGCAHITTRVRQEDGTYRTSKHWVLRSSLFDRSFSNKEDYMVAHEFHDVTYAWPQGQGNISAKFDEISFKSAQIECSVVGRQLTVNGSQYAEFEKGDRVRITRDGKVFVNDIEREPLGEI